MTRLRRLLPAALAAVSLLATACSDDGDGGSPRADGTPTAAASTTAPSTAPTGGSAAPSGPATPGSAAGSLVPPDAGLPPLSWRGCGDGFQCSTLPVPLVAGDPSKGTVDLALVRRRATRPSARIGSLVVNPGGPGASAVGYLRQAYAGLPSEVRARFDVVAFDPRGVGETAPVRCATTEELDRYFHLDPTPDDAGELRAYEQGNEQLVAGCQRRSGRVLPHLGTDVVADDLERVRQVLGDDRLTYLGYSYGTAIGAAYLDRYPTRVRAMVLDGALDPTLTWDRLLEGQSRGFDTALRAFLQHCERTRCAFRRAVRGDLGAAFDRLAAQVDRSPLPGEGKRKVGPGEFSLGVGVGLYSRDWGWPAIADALAAAQRGDGGPLLRLSDSYLERSEQGYANISEANVAVNCIDRPWPRDTASYVRLADRVDDASPRFGRAIALSGLVCADWPVPPVDAPKPVSGAGAPPVVVIGTTRDPATPYAWSVALAEQLDRAVLLTYDGDGHTVYRESAPACIQDRVDRYLLSGRTPSPVRC